MKTVPDGPGRATFVTEPGDRVALLDQAGHRITDVKVMGEDWSVSFDLDRDVPGFSYGVFDDADQLVFQSGDQGHAIQGTIFTITDRPVDLSTPRRCYDNRGAMLALLAVLGVVLALVAVGVLIGATLL